MVVEVVAKVTLLVVKEGVVVDDVMVVIWGGTS